MFRKYNITFDLGEVAFHLYAVMGLLQQQQDCIYALFYVVKLVVHQAQI